MDDGVLLLPRPHPPRSAAPHNPCPLFQGNDQVRFELTCYSLAPQIKVRRCFSRGGAQGSRRFQGQGQCARAAGGALLPHRELPLTPAAGVAHPLPAQVSLAQGLPRYLGRSGPWTEGRCCTPASVLGAPGSGTGLTPFGAAPSAPSPSPGHPPSALALLPAWKVLSQQRLEESCAPRHESTVQPAFVPPPIHSFSHSFIPYSLSAQSAQASDQPPG